MTEEKKFELVGNLLRMSFEARSLPSEEETQNATFEKVRKKLNKSSASPFAIPSFSNRIEKNLFNEARSICRTFGFSMWLCQAIRQDETFDSRYLQLMNYHLLKRYKK